MRPAGAPEGRDLSLVGARRVRTYTEISVPSGRTEIRPRSGPAELVTERPPPADGSAEAEKGVPGPLPHCQPRSISSPAPWNHTHSAPSRRSDLGVSGLGNPGPNPRPSRACARSAGSRGRAPLPRPSTARWGPGRKARGGGARRLGSLWAPSSPQPRAPCPRRPRGWGRSRRAGGAGPWTLGSKVGRRQAEGLRGPGCRARALAHLLVPGGLGAARARGTGRRLSGPGGRDARNPRAPPPSRLRSRLGLRARRAARRGWGRGRGGPRLGSAWGSGPPAGSAPERRARLRTWRPARSGGANLAPPGRTSPRPGSSLGPPPALQDRRPPRADTGPSSLTGDPTPDTHPRGQDTGITDADTQTPMLRLTHLEGCTWAHGHHVAQH